MTDGYAVIKNVAHNNLRGGIFVVVNRPRARSKARGLFGKIDRVSQRFLRRAALLPGHVLNDAASGLGRQPASRSS